MKRLLLFDIDGTLLTAGRAAKRAFRRALVETYGETGPIGTHDFAGKTDPQIARELLREAGLSDARIDDGAGEFWPLYLGYLERELEANGSVRTLPGVTELLDAIEDEPETAVLALLTGNVEGGAALKLRAAGLGDRFSFGVFGSDSERRPDLPALAVERALSLTGRRFDGRDIVVIGDTPHDITCGRSLGVRTVGVATGPYDEPALDAAGADTVVRDLSDTGRIVDLLLHAR